MRSKAVGLDWAYKGPLAALAFGRRAYALNSICEMVLTPFLLRKVTLTTFYTHSGYLDWTLVPNRYVQVDLPS